MSTQALQEREKQLAKIAPLASSSGGKKKTFAQYARVVVDSIIFMNSFRTLRDHVGDEPLKWDDIELFEKLGEGAYAEVFRGKWHNQIVAVKKLKTETISRQVLIDFNLEVSVLKKVHHKNIVAFYGVGNTPYNFLLEEYCAQTLSNVIESGQKFTPDVAFKYTMDIAQGMLYLHSSIPCVIHRDLKSSNLLISENNTIKICDMGLSKLKRVQGAWSNELYHMTPETGSYYYMAPEIFEHQSYSLKVDVYSFGLVVWEIFAGALVFATLYPKDAAQEASRHNNRPQLDKNWPRPLRHLLKKCWHEDSAARPGFDEIVVWLRDIEEEQRNPGGYVRKNNNNLRGEEGSKLGGSTSSGSSRRASPEEHRRCAVM